MRLFFLESKPDYQSYSFAYRPMVELEPGDKLADIYAQGFLPFSGDPEEPRHLFYLARSLRWRLTDFSLDKKRRYDFRQFEDLNPTFTVHESANAIPADWRDAAVRWMAVRFGEAYLSPARLNYILAKPFQRHFGVASIDGKAFGFVVLVITESCVHYWYSFYDVERFPGRSPGKWLMARTAQWARENGFSHLYVGTGYGTKAAYKTQGVVGAEFFDGSDWNPGLALLRERQAADPSAD